MIYTKSLKQLEGIPLVEKPVFIQKEVSEIAPLGGSAKIHKVKIQKYKFKLLCSTGEIELPDFQKIIET